MMTDQDTKRVEAVAEAVTICTAIKELILRLESERTDANAATIDATIAYCRTIGKKYYQLSKTPMQLDAEGRIIPVIKDRIE